MAKLFMTEIGEPGEASLSAEDEWSWEQDPGLNYQRDYSVKDANSIQAKSTRPTPDLG